MKIVSFFLIVVLFFSCKEKKVDQFEEYKEIRLTESRSKNLHGNISYTLTLPDTLKISQPYDIVFNFDSPFDTIVDPMVVDSLKFRTLTMFYYNPIKVGVKNKNDVFKAKDSILIPNKHFTLENLKFEEKGKYLFLVLIFDEIMYNYYNSEGLRDSVHFDRIFEEIKKEVVVID